MQTLAPQQVPTAQTWPEAQSEFALHRGSLPQLVEPSTQNPVPPVVLAQMQLPPGPHGPKCEHVEPPQPGDEHAPLLQMPEGHWNDVISIHALRIVAGSQCSVLTYSIPTSTTILWIIKMVRTRAGAQYLAGSAVRGASATLAYCS